MRRDLSPYAPLTLRRRRALDVNPFRMVWLNGVGWSVLLGTAGAFGAGIGMVTGRILVGTFAGLLVPAAAVGVDRLRWWNSWLTIRVESEELAHQVVGVLAAQGREAQVETYRWDDDDGSHVDHSVRVRQRNANAAAELADRSVPRRDW